MRHRDSRLKRRSIALLLAYALALQGLVVAWNAAASIAAYGGTGLPIIICSGGGGGGGGSGPAHRPDAPPPCCPCGPMCGPCAGPVLGIAPEAVPAVGYQPFVSAARWVAMPAPETQNAGSDPRKARAPPQTV